MTPEQIKWALDNRDAWSAETSNAPGDWTEANPTEGHCAAVAVIVYELCGGVLKSKNVAGQSHWYNHINGKDIDLTAEQFTQDEMNNATPGVVRFHEELNSDTLRRADLLARKAELPFENKVAKGIPIQQNQWVSANTSGWQRPAQVKWIPPHYTDEYKAKLTKGKLVSGGPDRGYWRILTDIDQDDKVTIARELTMNGTKRRSRPTTHTAYYLRPAEERLDREIKEAEERIKNLKAIREIVG